MYARDWGKNALKIHNALSAVDPSRFNADDARRVTAIRAQALALLAQFRRDVACRASRNKKQAQFEEDDTEHMLVGLLDTLDRYQTEIDRRIEVVTTRIKRIPEFTSKQTWKHFKARLLKAFEGSPIDNLTKLDLLIEKLDPRNRTTIEDLPYEPASFNEAIQMLDDCYNYNRKMIYYLLD